MTKNLNGKTAIITGGSRGIGAAIAKRLADDGANIAFTYSNSRETAEKLANELTSKGVKAKSYKVSASDSKAMKPFVDAVIKDFGAIDILVNNAGVFSMGNIGEVTQEEFDRVMQINVSAVFSLTNEVVKHLKSGARIINISSGVGERATAPSMGIYVASKFAVTGFSRAWAKDLGAKGILVNAVQPGPINTDMNPEIGDFAEFMKGQTALGRYGQPHEIAGLVSFLSGADSSYITGATINIDGGWNA
jgi:3-oxoacyl-[acyl-carrier protein] reductase